MVRFMSRLVCVVLVAMASATSAQPADAIYHSGNIYTMHPTHPRAEALAVRGDRLVAVGSDAEVLRHAGPNTQRVDLRGRTVLPGLIDAHGHMFGLGFFGLGRIDLSRAGEFEDLVRTVRAHADQTPAGEWILGGRWDHESWPSRALPRHEELSAATPDHPVWLRRVDGHAGLANEAAMRLAGITAETPNPAGGEIIRDAQGRPTGVLVDNAMRLVERVITTATHDPEEVILKAQEMCLAAGLTGVHDAGVSPAEIEAYRRLAADGRLVIRVYAMVSGPYAMRWFAENGVIVGDRLTVRSCKLYVDGAMGSRGAWLLEPYADRPVDSDGKPYAGLAVMDPARIQEIAEHALATGYQVCTHAIGDRGNREVLDAYARALARYPKSDHRFRIEHAQLLHLDDIPRFAAMGVIPSMQPTHCTSDMRWVEARVGADRARGAYAWASLLRTGARIAGGSDFPVESHNPFLGLYAAVTRQNLAGEPAGGWYASQRMTRDEALRSMTVDAAYAAFEENAKGALRIGWLADFIVVDRDVMTCETTLIPEARVLLTVVGGQRVFDAHK